MHRDTSIISYVENQLVEIPAGEIRLRDDRKNHVWEVVIRPFLMAKYTVTQQVYHALTGESPAFFKGEMNPVENVSWKEAVEFCNLLSSKAGLKTCYLYQKDNDEYVFDPSADGYRLPSEAEWEYACRAGTKGPRYGQIDEIAWYKDNSDGTTHPAGTKAPNPWGLCDMLGNVWEWCTDIYDEQVYGNYRLFRGGGWCDHARGCLATNRRRSHPSFRIDDLGFRIARNL